MLPASYRHWQDAARRLLEPLAALMQPGRADLPIAGAPSDHDAQADRLESFARPLVLAAFWLQSVPRPEDAALREKTAAWFRAGLALGTDPTSPHYWGPDASYHQHHVEMGLMAIGLQLAPRDLWEPLPAATKAQVVRWFATCRGGGIVNNNHLFMSVHILEFLRTLGAAHRTDAAVVTAHLNQLETMHRGGGWFEDGINQAYDHYNAYAFHFYGLMWAHLHGATDAKRAQRWRDWARLFVADYAHFFAASGEHPAFGRSITYRFNGLNVFGLALAENCTDLAPGLLRRLCTRNLDFFLARPIYTAQGALASGFTDVFPKIIEPYSAPASPYWAAKGFTPLLLPPEHAFWTEPEQPLPAERGFVRVMPAPGLVTRSTPDGEVEILNAGSMVGNTQLRYGAWKWSKLSYRTGVHFTYAFPEISNVSCDSALTQQLDDDRVFGRHSTVAVELDADHLGYSWNMGFKTGQVNTSVETFVFWRAGWLLHVHCYEARQPVVLRLGGFALPLTQVEPALRAGLNPAGSTGSTLAFFSPDNRGTVLQLLAGTATPDWDQRLDDATERRHVAAPYHVTPVFTTPRHSGAGVLVALSWSGSDRTEGDAWVIVTAAAGEWTLAHPKLGGWIVRHWSLPAFT
ncbi:DUF2264 domain-containing protein [Oleiharenicola lentus]|uniref:DUF2264 domain-containing protein n=1 Tax=Oleiharenicola lentus TaxID=2508720 RepID=A0A4Q1C6M2_9BACT|nr:DUF2264 domain-containing protein [Oleiharenicola lentus]RXK54535.1 DUF2264 domain-containing protein [Oleiharenicola lentus]